MISRRLCRFINVAVNTTRIFEYRYNLCLILTFFLIHSLRINEVPFSWRNVEVPSRRTYLPSTSTSNPRDFRERIGIHILFSAPYERI